jgi:integrase
MSRARLISPIYDHIEAAAIKAFVNGESYTQRAIATRIAQVTGEDVQPVAQRLPAFLKQLAKRGHYASQPAACGSKTGSPGELTSPRAFNWSPLSFDAPALRHAVATFLADDEIPGYQKAALRSALRLLLDLPTKCADGVIHDACERYAPEELYGLHEQAFECATARGLETQTAKNHRTAIRGLKRYAAERRIIPLVFPELRPDSAWTELMDLYLPLSPIGRTEHFILTMRSAWRNLHSTACLLFGDEVQFEDLTREDGERLVTHILLTERRSAVGYNVRRLLQFLGDRFQEGPFSGASSRDRFTVFTPGGRRPALYLRGPAGEAADGDWDGLCDLLGRMGFPESLTDFLRWYREYVTLRALDMIGNPRFPARRERHRISDKTSFERLTALRALLGAATNELVVGPEGEMIGPRLAPNDLTPEVVFGVRFPELVQVMVDWWRARAEVLPEGALGRGTSGALRQMVINLGMFALGHYERLRHQRKLKSASRTTQSGIEVVDAMAEEGVPKTAAEVAAWDAYMHANKLADALTDLERDGRGRTRKRNNDFRDISEILKVTPPAYWIALQNGMVDLFREAKRTGRDGSYEYHSLVLNAVMLGLLISTGCRIEELCLVRLDVQFDRAARKIVLRAIDRKNAKRHTVLIHPAYLPDDLLDEYLERSRPWFLKGRPIPRKPGSWRPRKPKRSRVQPHSFLLVSTSGRPFACLSETKNGQNRNEGELKRRAGQAGRRFQAQMATMARRFDMPVPSNKYSFGPHSVRGSCGFGIFLLHDEKAAAQYLGDTIETVRAAYSAIDGAHVDSSGLVGFHVAPSSPSASPAMLAPAASAMTAAPSAIDADYASELKELVGELKAGLITRNEFDRAKASLNKRYDNDAVQRVA